MVLRNYNPTAIALAPIIVPSLVRLKTLVSTVVIVDKK